MDSMLSSLSTTTQPNSAALSSPSIEFSSCNDPELALRTANPDVSMTTPGGGWWGDAPAQDRESGNDNDGVDGTSRSSTQSGNSNPKVKSTEGNLIFFSERMFMSSSMTASMERHRLCIFIYPRQ